MNKEKNILKQLNKAKIQTGILNGGQIKEAFVRFGSGGKFFEIKVTQKVSIPAVEAWGFTLGDVDCQQSFGVYDRNYWYGAIYAEPVQEFAFLKKEADYKSLLNKLYNLTIFTDEELAALSEMRKAAFKEFQREFC